MTSQRELAFPDSTYRTRRVCYDFEYLSAVKTRRAAVRHGNYTEFYRFDPICTFNRKIPRTRFLYRYVQ